MAKTLSPASQIVQFVEPGATHERYITLSVKIPRQTADAWMRLCQAKGLHALRGYRDAFASGLSRALESAADVNTEAATDARSVARAARAGAGPSTALVEHWQRLEAERLADLEEWHDRTQGGTRDDLGF